MPAKPRATQGALALTGSLPGECSLDLRRASRRNRSDRLTNRSDQISWRCCKEPSAAARSVLLCVGPEFAPTEVKDHLLARGKFEEKMVAPLACILIEYFLI